ncbi:MAG: glycosyltransferase family 2 protein [Sulfurimonadaceae bacterium]
MNTPMISVVMPVYNGEKYLHEAIKSILRQTYSNFEFIILNDGSTDKTEEIILSYDDLRIRYIKNETNLQIVETLNKGISLAKGKYIARMDADDISLPNRFEKQIHLMEQNPDIGVCGSWVEAFCTSKTSTWAYPVTSQNIKIALMFYCPFAHPSIVMRKKIFTQYHYQKEFQKAEDYYLWTQIKQKFNYANIPEVLLKYRLHEQQTSNTSNAEQLSLSNQIRLQELHKFGIHPTNEEYYIHEAISRYKYSDLQKSERWLRKLYEHNLKISYYDVESFKLFLDEKWWQIVHANSHNGIKTFFYYIHSDKLKFEHKTYMQIFKLFVKCLLKI